MTLGDHEILLLTFTSAVESSGGGGVTCCRRLVDVESFERESDDDDVASEVSKFLAAAFVRRAEPLAVVEEAKVAFVDNDAGRFSASYVCDTFDSNLSVAVAGCVE